jgi:hypothetical protein
VWEESWRTGCSIAAGMAGLTTSFLSSRCGALKFQRVFCFFSSFFILFHPLSTSMLMVPRFIETKSDDWLLWRLRNQTNIIFPSPIELQFGIIVRLGRTNFLEQNWACNKVHENGGFLGCKNMFMDSTNTGNLIS